MTWISAFYSSEFSSVTNYTSEGNLKEKRKVKQQKNIAGNGKRERENEEGQKQEAGERRKKKQKKSGGKSKIKVK